MSMLPDNSAHLSDFIFFLGHTHLFWNFICFWKEKFSLVLNIISDQGQTSAYAAHSAQKENRYLYVLIQFESFHTPQHLQMIETMWHLPTITRNITWNHSYIVTQTVLSIFVPLVGKSSLVLVCLKSSGVLWLAWAPPIVNLPLVFLQIYHIWSAIRCQSRLRQSPVLSKEILLFFCCATSHW